MPFRTHNDITYLRTPSLLSHEMTTLATYGFSRSYGIPGNWLIRTLNNITTCIQTYSENMPLSMPSSVILIWLMIISSCCKPCTPKGERFQILKADQVAGCVPKPSHSRLHWEMFSFMYHTVFNSSIYGKLSKDCNQLLGPLVSTNCNIAGSTSQRNGFLEAFSTKNKETAFLLCSFLQAKVSL